MKRYFLNNLENKHMIEWIQIKKTLHVTVFCLGKVKIDSVPVFNPPQFCGDQFKKLQPRWCSLGGVPEMGT